MPEDIASAPENYGVILGTKQPNFTYNLSSAVQKQYDAGTFEPVVVPYDRVQKIIPETALKLKELYPKLKRHEIDQILNIYFGPYRLSREGLREGFEKKDYVSSAAAQHAQVHALSYGSSGEADPEYIRKVFDMAVTHDNLAHAADAEGISTREFGMQSELAVARIFMNLHKEAKVYLPNYTGNGKSLDDEVRTWDVENGVDFCAVVPSAQGSTMFLTDAKGQYKYPTNDHLRRTGVRVQADVGSHFMTNQEINRLPLSLRQFIDEVDPSMVYKIRVVIPTGAEQLTPLQLAYEEYYGDKLETLRNFAQVGEEVEERVARSIIKLSQPLALAA